MLSAIKVKGLRKPGRYGDGQGLYLNVAPGGSKNWVQRITVDGKRRDLGLGGYPAISLARARGRAAENKTAIAEGKAPGPTQRPARKAPAPKVPTFGQAALEVHKGNMARFRSAKHGKNWIQMLEKYAMPTLGPIALNEIDRLDVLAVLTPIWTERPETARRVRQRIRTIFAWGTAHGYRDNNPAGEVITAALPAMPKQQTHFKAIHYAELAAALDDIRASDSGLAAKLALEFVALTAARSGEVRGATWGEIDFDRALWTIPASRMKGGVEHRVPLSSPALDLLRAVQPLRETGDYIFPSPAKEGRGLSDATLTKILRTIGLADCMTVHGMRSTFRDWAAEETATPWAVAELCLAHKVGTAVEQGYHRTDLLERRRELMDAWAAFLAQTA